LLWPPTDGNFTCSYDPNLDHAHFVTPITSLRRDSIADIDKGRLTKHVAAMVVNEKAIRTAREDLQAVIARTAPNLKNPGPDVPVVVVEPTKNEAKKSTKKKKSRRRSQRRVSYIQIGGKTGKSVPIPKGQPFMIRGRGKYAGAFGKAAKGVLRTIGGIGGAALGGAVGLPQIGGALGTAGADWLGTKIFGEGAYGIRPGFPQVALNTCLNLGQVPIMHGDSSGKARIQHREWIGPLSSTTAFNVVQYSINPGLANVFPWLSSVAENYASYRILGMVIEFHSLASPAASSYVGLGEVMMAVDFNPAANLPTSQQVMEQFQNLCSVKSSDNGLLPVECAPDGSGCPLRSLFVRTTTPVSGTSVTAYDHAVLFIATTGCPTGGINIGNVYVTYDIEFFNPQAPAQSVAPDMNDSAHYQLTAPANATPFGTAQTQMYDTIGLTFTGTSVTLPTYSAGTWLMILTATGNTGSAWTSNDSLTLSSNITSVKLFLGDNNYWVQGGWGGSASGTQYIALVYAFKVAGNAVSTITFASASGIPTGSNLFGDCFIFGIPLSTDAKFKTRRQLMRKPAAQSCDMAAIREAVTQQLDAFLLNHRYVLQSNNAEVQPRTAPC